MTSRLIITGFNVMFAVYIIGASTPALATHKLSKPSSGFKNSQAVKIKGLPNGAYGTPISTEEPFLSRYGRFLFFNTGKKENIRSRIMRSTRTSLSESFGKPKMINAIGDSDFVEGPTISGDAKELYYHKHDGKKFRLYKVTR